MKKILFRHARIALYPNRVGALLLLALMLLGVTANAVAETKKRADFDHLKTGFPLNGVHARQKCEDCHVQGIFKGTPTQCGGCHSAGNRIASTSKPKNHMSTALPCESCHTSPVSWALARFTHVGVGPGTCSACHGITATGKPAKHVATTAQCDMCHRTTAWKPASFSHAGVQPGTCTTCHGVTATDKPAKHIATTAQCDTCHRTSAWKPATFSHASVLPGTCTSCHGVSATGKPNGHIATTSQCDACHRTSAWKPATFSHASVLPGTCNSCHGISASGKPNGHFVTTRSSCDACHSTRAWVPTVRYSHTTPYYRPHNAGVTCTNCHSGNNEVIAWKFSAYKPDCAGCHMDKFVPIKHEKAGGGFYSVAELRDCTGACHSPTGYHRSTDGTFKK